jgi:methyl-accepting chemotaxis protein
MSDYVNDLSGKLGLDTTDFKTAIAAANRELRVIESGFRASAAALGDWAKDASGLELRIESLSKAMDLQKAKVGALQGEYDRVAAEKGKASRAAKDLEIRLNKETETLNKMQTELTQSEKALDEMGKETDQAGNEMQELGEKSQRAGSKLEGLKKIAGGLGGALKIGAKAVAGLSVAAAGATAAITGLVLKSADAAGELVDLSLQTGLSTTRLQELGYITGQLGGDVDTVASSMARLTRSMSDVGSNEAITAAFETLGVSARGANGELRDSEVVFGEVIDALGKVTNETERDALAMEIFGRSAMELNPLIKAGSDEIARLTDEAHTMGAVMAEEDVAGLEEFGDELAGLKSGLSGTLGTLATGFLPAFRQMTGGAKQYLGQFANIVKGADGDLGKMAEGVGALLGQIVTDIAAQGPKLLEAGLGILQGIINAVVTNLPVMLPGVIAMITSLVQFIVDNLPLLINAGIMILMALVNGLLPQLPMLIEAALQMVITLANGIAQALPTLIPTVLEIIPQIILTLLENLPMLIQAALDLILALAEGLVAAIPILLPYIPQIVTAIFDALIAALPMIGTAAAELIVVLLKGIIGALPSLGRAGVQLIGAIVKGIVGLYRSLTETGKNIVVGIWNGIKANAGWFWQQITGFFSGIVQGVKDVLGIKSPSTIFAGIGENMALGMGKGFAGAFAAIERDINAAVGGLAPALSPTINAGGQSGTAGAAQPVVVHVHANVRSETDWYRAGNQMGKAARRTRWS